MRIASRHPVSMGIIFAALALTPGLSRAQQGDSNDACRTPSPRFRVGYTIEYLNVTGTLGENRPIQVHVWYPAREQDDCGEAADFEPGPGGCHAPLAVYTSRLRGMSLSPTPWDALSWSEPSTVAFQDARIARGDERFPVIVFSHGSNANAIDYAYLLEAFASYGYVVAAPDHMNDTQDDILIDYLTTTAKQTVIPCLDGTASPCTAQDVKRTMVDRARDIGAVYEALPTWFGHRVDMARVGIMGHSRGSVTALTVGGGSGAWGIAPDSRFKAILGLSIGAAAITSNVDVQKITVPTLLISGTLEPAGLQKTSESAFKAIAATDKQRFIIQNATHRHFSSALCAQMHGAAAVAQGDANAILDLHTAKQYTVVGPNLGLAMDFCGIDSFMDPDIRSLIASLTGFNVTPADVPRSGLTSSAADTEVLGQAVPFFARVLNCGEQAQGDAARRADDSD